MKTRASSVIISPHARRWSPPIRPASVDAFPEHRQLRRGQPRGAIPRRGPRKAPPLENLVVEAEPLAVPVENLDPVAAPAAEHEDGAARRLLPQLVLRQRREPR